jgi:hypothetical protein
MAITYHSGERIQATSTDFGTDGAGIPAISGGWVEVGRTTLGSANNVISVSSLADKRYYMILQDQQNISSADNIAARINNDSSGTNGVSGNYADRYSVNGGSDATQVSQTSLRPNGNASQQTGQETFTVGYLTNLSAQEKLDMFSSCVMNGTGAGNAPNRGEAVNKWANTSSVINRYDLFAGTGSSTFDTGSEVVVLGWDPADTHTSNFWEELASVTLGSDSSSSGSIGSPQMETGTFTAKKYLWVQGWIKSSTDFVTTFNSNSSSIFSHRYNDNGGTDGTSTNSNSAWFHYGGDQMFVNAFIINNASTEKLMIKDIVYRGSSGAGTAPATRREIVSKWANTSDQITSLQLWKASMTISAGSTLKVWGSD